MVTRTFVTPSGSKFVLTCSFETLNMLVEKLHLVYFSC